MGACSPKEYTDFVRSKLRTEVPSGLARVPELNERLFPFQRDVVAWALQRGRAAIFADCGLGKTAMQLEWAQRVVEHTGGRVLILAPLAVAPQTCREGQKFGIEVRYAHKQSEVRDGITIANYERLDRFDVETFAGVVLDESSILKAFVGKTKRALVERCQRVPYRLACTATPAPNDHMELGNHSEFLGLLQGNEMLGRWFINDTSSFGSYRLKGHAVVPFWDWVSSWAMMVGKPSDIGHDDAGYDMPELHVFPHVVDVDVTTDRGGALFRIPGMSATKVHEEKRRTVDDRARRVAELVAAEPDESWIVWCDTDYEADALTKAMPGAVEVRGSHKVEAKERAALDFVDGKIRTLVSKPRIFGWGMNWQHCARVAFVGATYSYESFYQAIRRTWRFGQTRPVHAHVMVATTEMDVWNAMLSKQRERVEMQAQMFAAARRAQSRRDGGRSEAVPAPRNGPLRARRAGQAPGVVQPNDGGAGGAGGHRRGRRDAAQRRRRAARHRGARAPRHLNDETPEASRLRGSSAFTRLRGYRVRRADASPRPPAWSRGCRARPGPAAPRR
jgi:hypothetical protein